jgi:hypothetical protein
MDIEAIEAEVRRLSAIEAIKNLKARYYRSMDEKRWDDYGAVFATDAVFEAAEASLVLRGRAEIQKYVSSALAPAVTVHHGHMPEIEITGPDTARAVWAMFDCVEGRANNPLNFHGYGHYHEEYVVEDGEWRIKRLVLTRLRVDPFGSLAAAD